MKRLLLSFLLVGLCSLGIAFFEFKNIKCEVLDKNFCGFEYCYLKSINRTYKYFSLKVNLFKIPITNIVVQFSVFKRANGYKPFLFSKTFDSCKFIRAPKDIVVKFFYSLIVPFTNINHTCPYDHDLVVEKLPVSYLNNQLTEVLPMPAGDYMLFSTWMAYGVPRANFTVYMTLR